VPPGELDRLVDAAARAARAERVRTDSRLRLQIGKGGVDVAGPLAPDLPLVVGSPLPVRLAAALPVAAVVQREDVEPVRGEIGRETVPARALLVALVEEEDAGTGASPEE
jgi:hypothetical protein